LTQPQIIIFVQNIPGLFVLFLLIIGVLAVNFLPFKIQLIVIMAAMHTNVEALQLLDNGDLVRRLLRIKPFELV
jgi:hypothetical protein